jgi:hypothetical protein
LKDSGLVDVCKRMVEDIPYPINHYRVNANAVIKMMLKLFDNSENPKGKSTFLSILKKMNPNMDMSELYPNVQNAQGVAVEQHGRSKVLTPINSHQYNVSDKRPVSEKQEVAGDQHPVADEQQSIVGEHTITETIETIEKTEKYSTAKNRKYGTSKPKKSTPVKGNVGGSEKVGANFDRKKSCTRVHQEWYDGLSSGEKKDVDDYCEKAYKAALSKPKGVSVAKQSYINGILNKVYEDKVLKLKKTSFEFNDRFKKELNAVTGIASVPSDPHQTKRDLAEADFERQQEEQYG